MLSSLLASPLPHWQTLLTLGLASAGHLILDGWEAASSTSGPGSGGDGSIFCKHLLLSVGPPQAQYGGDAPPAVGGGPGAVAGGRALAGSRGLQVELEHLRGMWLQLAEVGQRS